MSSTNYIDYKKHEHDRSYVWQNFLRAEDGTTALCKHCKRKIKCVGGSTSGLRTHLRTAHSIFDVDRTLDNTSRPSTSSATVSTSEIVPKKAKITDFLISDNTTPLVISRMCALDGLAFQTFCTSKDLRALLQHSGHKIPTSANSIREIVLNTAGKIQESVKRELFELKRKGQNFTITFDEWTSLSNKRFMNINVHFLKLGQPCFINLGLIRILGSMIAEECIRLIRERLNNYGLSLDSDIVAMVTDGCSLMQKVGKTLPCVHQVCLAHGVQLAILDVMYNSKNKHVPPSLFQQQTEQSESTDEENDDNVLSGFEVDSVPIAHNQIYEFKNFQQVVDKVRKVVRLFKRSPVRNSTLQIYVTQELGHELNLKADCKTRWSSMAEMLTIFLKIRGPVIKALIDIKSDITFTVADIQNLENLSSCLSLIKSAVEMICRRDATLLTADAIIQFTIKKLNESNHQLARDLAAALLIRINDRRLIEASLLSYLHNPTKYFEDREAIFQRPAHDETLGKLVTIVKRLNIDETNVTICTNDEKDVNITDNTTELNLKEQMEKVVKDITSAGGTSNVPETTNDLQRIVQIEMALFDNGGLKGKYLSQIYNALLTIVPTSVEAERAFSAAGILCTRVRASLSDRSLDALCFLRSHFKEKEKAKEVK